MQIRDEQIWNRILTNVVSGPLSSFFDYYPEMKTKDMSGNISAILTIEAAREYNNAGINCICEKIDRDPDLFFPDMKLNVEIKATRNKGKAKPMWQAGSLTKRSGIHVLVAWEKIPLNLDGETGFCFYVTSCNVEKSEWKSQGEDYYATKINFDEIVQRHDIIGRVDSKVFFAVNN